MEQRARDGQELEHGCCAEQQRERVHTAARSFTLVQAHLHTYRNRARKQEQESKGRRKKERGKASMTDGPMTDGHKERTTYVDSERDERDEHRQQHGVERGHAVLVRRQVAVAVAKRDAERRTNIASNNSKRLDGSHGARRRREVP